MLKEYVGNELMAIFGAPLEYPDHAKKACAAALAMRNRRRALHEEWREMGRPLLKARTGVNSGNMLVGNLGSRYRFAYGCLGDNVNLGSRLEGLNKMYATEIIIGENTANFIDADFQLRELDVVRVKGKSKPVRIYELLEQDDTPAPESMGELVKEYASGFAADREQYWREALYHFTRCLEITPEDGPSRVMLERCRIYLETPPPEDWDGFFEHANK